MTDEQHPVVSQIIQAQLVFSETKDVLFKSDLFVDRVQCKD